ncbi:MAG: hypothetical protein HYU99_06405 [Deltaproteobacteria bacterium]|nr:hypothetical protein [Deltaproteobacteria bacterium]
MPQEIQDPMEYIWEKVPKTKEGFIHYLPGDIPYLYRNGFVDSTRFAYPQWKNAFDDCKQADGSYLVSKEKFMSLRPYRYTGPVFKPFDPNLVREGEWTDEDLKKLYFRSIKPSSGITEEVFWNSVKALKDQGLVKGGNLLVDATVKKQLAYLIERFPSPRRRLEKEVNRIREERETQARAISCDRDASGFVGGKLSSEAKVEDLKKLQSSAPVRAPVQTYPDEAPAVDIKKLRKPGKKITG